ncbi:hypothetical protein AB4144_13945, partial [Rhizobiaceae sp. 2RAB30]
VGSLEATGVPSSDISIVANNSSGWYDDGVRVGDDHSDAGEGAAAGAGVGAAIGGAGGLLAGLGLMAIPGVGPVVAAGWLASTALGAAAGAAVGGVTGGILGALTDSGVPEQDAHVYAEGVRRGGTLVTARVEDELAEQAQRIMNQHQSVDLAARRRDYEADGWTEFDSAAPNYVADDRGREPDRFQDRQ